MKKIVEYKMGNSSARILLKFRYLSNFPYTNWTNKDLHKLDRRVNQMEHQIKNMGLSKRILKALFKRGFTSKQLLSWFNRLIDSSINHKNMTIYVQLAKLAGEALNRIEWIEPLPVLYQKYRKAVVEGKKEIASQHVRTLALLVVPLAVHVNIERKEDTILLKETASLLKSLQTSYISDNFSDVLENKPVGGVLVSGLGILTDTEWPDRRDVRQSYGFERTFDDGKYIYIPSDRNGLVPYVTETSIVRFGSTRGTDIPLTEFVVKYNITVRDGDSNGKWYKIDAVPTGEYQYTILTYPSGDPPVERWTALTYSSDMITLFNNPEGVKVENARFVYYTSERITTFPTGAIVTHYENVDQLNIRPLNDEVRIFTPETTPGMAGLCCVIGPYGYLCPKVKFDTEHPEIIKEYNEWADLFSRQQNRYLTV